MFPLLKVFYHGEQTIDYWEYLMALVFVAVMYVYFARRKSLIKDPGPEYRFYMPALLAKLVSSFIFTLFYFYYYEGGDSPAYFYSGLAMRNLALENPMEYLRQLFGDNSLQAWNSYNLTTAKPFLFMFADDRTFAVIRFVSVVAFFTFRSYLLTNLCFAAASFFAVWACYRTFVSYFPQLSGKLAIGFLFMPSSVFWGSPILKDTISFSAVCWWVHAVDELFFKKRNTASSIIGIICSATLMIMVKPYIFMVLLAATLLWLFYFRLVGIRNLLIRFVLLPIIVAVFVGSTLFILTRLGGSFDKFALDGALQSIEVTQKDLIRSEAYGSKSFDVGDFDGTWLGLFSKLPVAVNAAFFRPYLWECSGFAMYLSGLENAWVLAMAVLALVRAGPKFFIRCMAGIPLMAMSMVFAVLFAFVVGVSTPNFGALVRFKIPMVPFFISSMYIIVYLARIKWALEQRKLKFDLREFRLGSAHVGSIVDLVRERKRKQAHRRMAVQQA